VFSSHNIQTGVLEKGRTLEKSWKELK